MDNNFVYSGMFKIVKVYLHQTSDRITEVSTLQRARHSLLIVTQTFLLVFLPHKCIIPGLEHCLTVVTMHKVNVVFDCGLMIVLPL